MCSIFGGVFPDRSCDPPLIRSLRERCRDRGRDGTRHEVYESEGRTVLLGACRAAPTTERRPADLQPYEGVVHNGTIANDRELGNPEGEVDSRVLPRVLDRADFHAFRESVGRLRGSFAIAALSRDRRDVYLARNYRPIHLLQVGGATLFASTARQLSGLAGLYREAWEMPPYTCMRLGTGHMLTLRRERSRKALVIASGGLDSTTAAYDLRANGWRVDLIHFLYGCRAQDRELGAVKRIAERLGAEAYFVPFPAAVFAGKSSLLDSRARIAGPTEGAEFAHEWVPARNFAFVALATAFAEANGYGAVALGTNLEEAGAYPDNEEQFTHLLGRAMDYAVADGRQVRLLAPLGRLMKHEVVRSGLALGVPYGLTWSCHRDGETPCNDCGSCYMRRVAFERNGAADPPFAG